MTTRRDFLKTTSRAGLLGTLGSFVPFDALTAEDSKVTPDIVRLTSDIEPIVQLIEKTPREKCLEVIAERLRKGLPYRQLLAALFLAGIRNVNPQPPGFKFHCVFVIHAAHQISLDAPIQERLLPILWALDNFKASQAKDVQEGDFQLRPVKGKLPSPETAWKEFHEAMEDWDEERADRAIVSLVRHRGAHEIIEQMWQYGARDYRNIGHKAIFVANTWKTLQTIGWQHAEPALRSLVLGLLDFGKVKMVNSYAYEDQAITATRAITDEMYGLLPGDWTRKESKPSASKELLSFMRNGKAKQSIAWTIEELIQGQMSAQSVWDAVHLAAGELMMRQPGIYGIHTVTSTNALRYAFETSSNRKTRLLLLLQGIGWMCQFQNFMSKVRGGLKNVRIDRLMPDSSDAKSDESIDRIFATLNKDAPSAATAAMTLANQSANVRLFKQTARSLIIKKGTDAHDYKYSVSIFEDYDRVSPEFRPHMLATSVYHLRGSSLPDAPIFTPGLLKSLK